MYPLPLFEIRHQIFYLALLSREPDSYIQKDRRNAARDGRHLDDRDARHIP